MSQLESAAVKLIGVTLAFLLVAWFVWRKRQGETVPAAPKMPRSPSMPREFKLPALSRKERAVAEEPVEISPSRLARVSGKAPLAGLSEPAPEPEPSAPPPDPEARAMAEAMLASMVAQVEHEADLVDRRGNDAVAIRLVPQIPPRDADGATSWLGGTPRLDARTPWPEIRETPADFLAQIDCAALPAELWDGLGPRSGALAFFIHPRDGDMLVVHVAEPGDPVGPPRPQGDDDVFFAPHGGLRFGDLMPFTRRAFPQWPVDLVAVRPGDPDPRDAEGGDDGPGHRLYRAGYDIADPAWHPFDWASMTAMAEILDMRISRFWRDPGGAPSPIEVQLANIERRLGEPDTAEGDPLDRTLLENQLATLTELAEAAHAAAEMNREALANAQEIIAIVRESAGRDEFSPAAAAAVMGALQTIRWAKVNRKPDPAGRPGAEAIETLILPLTEHHPDAPLWAHDYHSIWFDHAKHAYAAGSDALSPEALAVLEPYCRELAAREMGGIGHVPFAYVHDYDADADATMLELPSSGLMSWMFGDVDHLVLTMRKADLAAGRLDRPVVQVSN
ncbi:DUF1963 domain-containing protein [Sphingopyxis macrogoltabida]|uniref:DUF1963 domain-containing protein n=1 Tax=Sphingopyxis macrogoltabida TaxID=33050 RepID=A0A0N9UEH3_SPHMC|nr:DUF1963 domain-containing protein [Sphingopyxis macrogoltabida]ALH82112.1 hypothetical protein AN936_17635 [Sphingopyxis macrogoltabida]